MQIEWLYEAQAEYRDLVTYYRVNVGQKYAEKFSKKILSAVLQLEQFPEMGVLKSGTRLGKNGFRALFIDNFVCIYRFDGDTVYIYHLADARTNYMYNIFGIDS